MRKLNKIQISNYTLMEMLVIIGVLGLFLIAVAKFSFDANQRCTNVTRKILLNQEIKIIKDKWRNFIHQCREDIVFSAKENSLISGNRQAVIKENKLVLMVDGEKREYKIPSYLNAEIKLIKNPEFHEIAVLGFSYKKMPKVLSRNKEFVRIAACPKEVFNEK